MPRPRKAFLIDGVSIKLDDAPGLELRKRKATARQPERIEFYWVAPAEARRRGYDPATVRLHGDLRDPAKRGAIGARCRLLTEEAKLWLANGSSRDTRPVYDGTLHSLIACYQRDPLSPYRRVKQNTRESYDDWCRVLDRKFGARRVDRLLGQDFRRWFEEIAAPIGDAPPRLRLARGCVRQMLPILFAYGAEVGLSKCKELYGVLEIMEFKVSQDVLDLWHERRQPQQAMTYAQAEKIVAAGLSRRQRRYRSVALGVAAQFEFTVAQIDVIGWWQRTDRARPLPPAAIMRGGKLWRPGLRYEDFLPDMILDLSRSKTGNQGVFDVREYPLFVRALAAVPEEERSGPLAVDDHGVPFQRRYYAKLYRELADAAGVPAEVCNMNARHGGGTEADAAGVPLDDISTHLQHSSTQTTKRHYIKPNVAATRRVARARVASRQKKDSA